MTTICPECWRTNGKHEEWSLKRLLWFGTVISCFLFPQLHSQDQGELADQWEQKAFTTGQVFWSLRKENLLNEETVDYAEELFKAKAFESLREEYSQFDFEVADTAFEEGAQSVGEPIE